MTAMKKRNLFTSPVGTASYAYLNKPDTQFDAAGVYKTELKVSNDNAKSLMDNIKKVAEAEFGNKAVKATMPYSVDEETGEVTFKMKSKYKPKFADTTGSLIHENKVPNVYGGATIKVQGNLYPYSVGGSVGVSLQMYAVQIIELQNNSNYAGFESEEGSYVAAANDNEVAEGDEDYNF